MAKPRRGEINVDGFAGLNELLSPFDLGDDEENWLVKAQNIDVDDGKSIKRRPGFTKIGTFTNPHSLWSDGETALFAEQGNLRKVDSINDSAVSSSIVLSGAGESNFGYAKLHDQIFFSNDKKNGMLLSDGSFHNWEVETPSGQPTLSTTTGALVIDKSISVFVTYIDDLGRESGASGIATLETAGTVGVSLTNIPVPSSSDIVEKVIYSTPPDGDMFYMVDVVGKNTTSYNITSPARKTVQAKTLFLSEPPIGNILAAESGVIWVASGKWLYRSEPFMPHLFNKRQHYYPFAEDITMVAPVDGGIYVAADETYFIDTTQEVPQLAEVFAYGAVEGSLAFVPAEKVGKGGNKIFATWLSEKGQIIAGPGGQAENVTEEKTAITEAKQGSSYLREDDGYTRIISTYKGGESAGLRATDYIEATITKCPAISEENTADNYYYTADSTTITADAA